MSGEKVIYAAEVISKLAANGVCSIGTAAVIFCRLHPEADGTGVDLTLEEAEELYDTIEREVKNGQQHANQH